MQYSNTNTFINTIPHHILITALLLMCQHSLLWLTRKMNSLGFFLGFVLCFYFYPTIVQLSFQATFMVRLPPLGLAVFNLYDSSDSPMTLRSDTLLRLSGGGVAPRATDPLPVRSQQADSQTFYISSQSLTLGFSGTTGLLEVCSLSVDQYLLFFVWFFFFYFG